MRVVLTTYRFPDDRQAFIELYVRALLERGVEVSVVATAGRPRSSPPNPKAVETPAPTVVSASWEDRRIKKLATLSTRMRKARQLHPQALRSLVKQLWREHRFRKELLSRLYVLVPPLSEDADVVHLGWLSSAANWVELVRVVEGPLVVSCHGSDLRIDPIDDLGYRERVRAVFDRADLVHCVSDDLASRAVGLGADAGKVFVRAWGVDTDRFRPGQLAGPTRAARQAPIQILSVGRLHWVKGYEFALLALRQLHDAGVVFEYTVIGDGKPRDRRAVLATIRDLGLEDCVRLRGARPQSEVVAAMQEADLFLMSSVSEGLSTVTLEAMAVGVPVVVTDVGGMHEAVADGVEGRVVPPRDPTALADALHQLATDADLRAIMGRRARQRAVEAFDSRETARIMVEQYQRITTRHAGLPSEPEADSHHALP